MSSYAEEEGGSNRGGLAGPGPSSVPGRARATAATAAAAAAADAAAAAGGSSQGPSRVELGASGLLAAPLGDGQSPFTKLKSSLQESLASSGIPSPARLLSPQSLEPNLRISGVPYDDAQRTELESAFEAMCSSASQRPYNVRCRPTGWHAAPSGSGRRPCPCCRCRCGP